MEKFLMIAEPGKRELITKRIFDASPEMVFKASINFDTLPRYWGNDQFITTVEKYEAMPGGQYRIIQKDKQGINHAFHGVFHTVDYPNLLIYTFEYEAFPGHVALITIKYEPMDDKTVLTEQMVFQTVTDRDGMLVPGMEQDLANSYDQLEMIITEMMVK